MTEDQQVTNDTVPAHLAGMKFEYEGSFAVPSFDLMTRRPELLRALHKEFSDLYDITAEDVQVSDGSRLSDGRVSINLFSDNATIEVTPDEFRMVLDNLPGWNILQAVGRQCIESAIRAITDSIPEVSIDLVAIEVTLQINTGDEKPARHLLNRAARTTPFDFSGFGDVSQYHDVNFEIKNDEEQWTTLFRVRADLHDESMLILSCYTLYEEDGKHRDPAAQIEHVHRVIRTLLPQVGVSLP